MTKISKKIIFISALSILFGLNALNILAAEITPAYYVEESMSRHLALENTGIYPYSTTNNTDTQKSKEVTAPEFPAIATEEYSIAMQKLQEVDEKVTISLEKINKSMNTLRFRNEIKAFIIGSNLGVLKFNLVQIEDQSYILDNLSEKTPDRELKAQIQDRANSLKDKTVEVANFISEQENKISLLGWFRGIL